METNDWLTILFGILATVIAVAALVYKCRRVRSKLYTLGLTLSPHETSVIDHKPLQRPSVDQHLTSVPFCLCIDEEHAKEPSFCILSYVLSKEGRKSLTNVQASLTRASDNKMLPLVRVQRAASADTYE